MPADNRLTINLTEAQMKAVQSEAELCGFKSLAEFFKHTMRYFLSDQNIHFPDDETTWGGKRTPKNDGSDTNS